MTDNTELTTAQGAGANLQAMQRRQYDAVHCLLLPLHKEIGLLPNASVAEIIPYIQPEIMDDAPEWLLGMINWRERHIPVISLEMASEGQISRIHKSCRIAIVNTLNGNNRLPYFGILMQSLPSLQIIRPNAIHPSDPEPAVRPSIKSTVNVNGTTAIIPDIDDLEMRLINLVKAS
ncbi:MAG: chemotaxis protein CheW [Gammaproteobacteria bacterium]|nr:chemotaxis protein CheW [Gammaproteobacteria bacterium]